MKKKNVEAISWWSRPLSLNHTDASDEIKYFLFNCFTNYKAYTYCIIYKIEMDLLENFLSIMVFQI